MSTVNSLFSALFMSYIERLPQLLRRKVFVLSAHQIVIGKELDIDLSNLQPQFGIRIVHKKVGSLTNILPQFGIVQATNPSCLLYFP